MTASHQIKHWECTLPSLTSWITVTALTYFKLECGLFSPVSSQNMKRQFCPKWTPPHDPCVTASFVYKFPRVCLCGGTRNKTGDHQTRLQTRHEMFVPAQERELAWAGSTSGWHTASCLKPASLPLDPNTCSPKASPVFCILHVFVNWVSGGMDSPSPMVTSSTNDMEGTLIFGLSKS